jgi:hypothetical protein
MKQTQTQPPEAAKTRRNGLANEPELKANPSR